MIAILHRTGVGLMLSVRTGVSVALVQMVLFLPAGSVAAQSPHRPPYQRASKPPAQAPGTQVQTYSKELDATQPGGNPNASPTSATVDVINGSARQTKVFDEEQPPANSRSRSAHKKTAKRNQQRAAETKPSVPDVEVINGARLETRRFEGAEDEIATPWIERQSVRPVVVGVSSVESASGRGGTARAGSTANLVIGVASSESRDRGANSKPIAYRLSPGPSKRAPYHPGPPGF
jgi:hypothetical protein